MRSNKMNFANPVNMQKNKQIGNEKTWNRATFSSSNGLEKPDVEFTYV